MQSRYRPPHVEEEWCLPIHVAAFKGRPRILSLLLAQAGADPNARNWLGYTPLMEVCNGLDMSRPGDFEECIDALLSAHADVNAPANSGETVLHHSVNRATIPVRRGMRNDPRTDFRVA